MQFLRGEPYFDDGNIILATNDETPTAFRLHRGMLMRQSEIFSDIFAMPQPDADGIPMVDGCQIVTMHDLPSELSDLLKALYDGPTFGNRNIYDFFYLAGILRISTKYFIASLRQRAIEQLTQIWAPTLRGHDVMVEAALSAEVIEGLTYPYVHPLHVLNLARETHVRIVIPSVLYFLSLYRIEDLLRGDHPKLQVQHPSRPSSALSPSDITDYTIVFQRRIERTMEFVRRIVEDRQPAAGCTSGEACTRSFRSLASRLSRTWMLRTALLHYILQVTRDVSTRRGVCSPCHKEFQDDCDAFREEVWKSLPTSVGMPPWETLESELSQNSTS